MIADKNTFDKKKLFKLSAAAKKDAEELYELLLEVISEESYFKKITDPTILDMLTYELLRLCRTKEYHYVENSYKFTNEFVHELKKHQNRNVLGDFLKLWFNIGKREYHIIMNLAFQSKLAYGTPVYRKEAYGQYIDDIDNIFGVVPFWVEPKENFMEHLFLFRFSLICSQSELSLSRDSSLRLVEKMRLKNLSKLKKDKELTITKWLNAGLPILKSVGKSDPISAANKALSSKLTTSWAILFTHLDYSRIISWRKIASEKNLIKSFVVQTLAPISLDLIYALNNNRNPEEIFFQMDKRLKSEKIGKLFKLKTYSDDEIKKLYTRIGSFGYAKVLFPNLDFVEIPIHDSFALIDYMVTGG